MAQNDAVHVHKINLFVQLVLFAAAYVQCGGLQWLQVNLSRLDPNRPVARGKPTKQLSRFDVFTQITIIN